MSRLLRCLVCLLVICCLLINCSPIRAEATLATPIAVTMVAVGGVSVAASVLIGLGILPAANLSPFDNLVDSCLTHLQDIGLISEMGTIDVFGYKISGYSMFGITPRIIEAIRDWLFDSEVCFDTGAQVGFMSYNGYLAPELPSELLGTHPYVFMLKLSNGFQAFFGTSSDFVISNSSIMPNSNFEYHLYASYNGDDHWGLIRTYQSFDVFNLKEGLIWSNFDIYTKTGDLYIEASDPIPSSLVDSSLDLELGVIAPSDTAISDGYSTWADSAITVPGEQVGSDEEEIPIWPIGLGQTYEDTRGLSQTDVWTGTSTYEDVKTETDTWQPPENPGKFALDLTNYFPFCIPFDLYDFLSCLNADPVTPVISWEIPLPGGSTYPLELDFSPFDSVAQLLRRLELLLFCVGLAIKTRDLIKG